MAMITISAKTLQQINREAYERGFADGRRTKEDVPTGMPVIKARVKKKSKP